ncbi:dbp7p [Cystoisospora suis]|uniref:RNA helicase n=1 Tax=Cystoisospora suis TaxID=483139 RepID=A0A2C6KRG8_9APIC|nr:dbp7p [Cystoisospora suis]
MLPGQQPLRLHPWLLLLTQGILFTGFTPVCGVDGLAQSAVICKGCSSEIPRFFFSPFYDSRFSSGPLCPLLIWCPPGRLASTPASSFFFACPKSSAYLSPSCSPSVHHRASTLSACSPLDVLCPCHRTPSLSLRRQHRRGAESSGVSPPALFICSAYPDPLRDQQETTGLPAGASKAHVVTRCRRLAFLSSVSSVACSTLRRARRRNCCGNLTNRWARCWSQAVDQGLPGSSPFWALYKEAFSCLSTKNPSERRGVLSAWAPCCSFSSLAAVVKPPVFSVPHTRARRLCGDDTCSRRPLHAFASCALPVEHLALNRSVQLSRLHLLPDRVGTVDGAVQHSDQSRFVSVGQEIREAGATGDGRLLASSLNLRETQSWSVLKSERCSGRASDGGGQGKVRGRSRGARAESSLTLGQVRTRRGLKLGVPSSRPRRGLASNPGKCQKYTRVAFPTRKRERESRVAEVTIGILGALNAGGRHAVDGAGARIGRQKAQRGEGSGRVEPEGVDGQTPRRDNVSKGKTKQVVIRGKGCSWSRKKLGSLKPGRMMGAARLRLRERTRGDDDTGQRRFGADELLRPTGVAPTLNSPAHGAQIRSAVGPNGNHRQTAERQDHRPVASPEFLGFGGAIKIGKQHRRSQQARSMTRGCTAGPDTESAEELLGSLGSSNLPLSTSWPGIRLLPPSLTSKHPFKQVRGLVDLTALSHLTPETLRVGSHCENSLAGKHTVSDDQLSHYAAGSLVLGEDQKSSASFCSNTEIQEERDELKGECKFSEAKAAGGKGVQDEQLECTADASAGQQTSTSRLCTAKANHGTDRGVGSSGGAGVRGKEERGRWSIGSATPTTVFDREGFEAVGIRNPALLRALKSAAIVAPTEIQRLTSSRLLLGKVPATCCLSKGAISPDAAPSSMSLGSSRGNTGSPFLHLPTPSAHAPGFPGSPASVPVPDFFIANPFLAECGKVGTSVFLVEASTGSGKTLAYLLPLLQRLLERHRSFPRRASDPSVEALILAPGRELAAQIYSVCQTLVTNISRFQEGLDRNLGQLASSSSSLGRSSGSLRCRDGTAAPTAQGVQNEFGRFTSEGSCLAPPWRLTGPSSSPVQHQQKKRATAVGDISAPDAEQTKSVVCTCLVGCSCNPLLRPFLLLGGANAGRQIKRLKKQRPNIIVATPGRLASFLTSPRGRVRRLVSLRACSFVVLDEGDALLESKQLCSGSRESYQKRGTAGDIAIKGHEPFTSLALARWKVGGHVKGKDTDRDAVTGDREFKSGMKEQRAETMADERLLGEGDAGGDKAWGSLHLTEPASQGDNLDTSQVAKRMDGREARRQKRLVWQMAQRLRMMEDEWERKASYTLRKERQARRTERADLLQKLKGQREGPEAEEEKLTHSSQASDVLWSVLRTIKQGNQSRLGYKQQSEMLARERIKRFAELRQRLSRELMVRLSKPPLSGGRHNTLVDVRTIMKHLRKHWASERTRSEDERNGKPADLWGEAGRERESANACVEVKMKQARTTDGNMSQQQLREGACLVPNVSFSVCSTSAAQSASLAPPVSPSASSVRQLLLVSATVTRLPLPSVREKLLMSRRAHVEVLRSSSLWGTPELSYSNHSAAQRPAATQERALAAQQMDVKERAFPKENDARPPDNVIHMFVESTNDDTLRNLKKFLKAEPLEKRLLIFCNKQKSAAWLEAWLRNVEPAIETGLLNGWLPKAQRRSRLRQLLHGQPSSVSATPGKKPRSGWEPPTERGTRFAWITTDVATRGLDFVDVDIAVNLQLPTGKMTLERFSRETHTIVSGLASVQS